MELVTFGNVSFSYPNQDREALRNLSLSIAEGDFVIVCGPSGCGKSTLLRHMKTCLTPHGRRSGEIRFSGRRLSDVDERTQAGEIGFVLQSPDNQVVTDKVWHELAFGPESLGYDSDAIRRRVAEVASFFGIENWFYKPVCELSGGQKQILSLASVLTMSPKMLVLDEPTAQLDPVAASDFLALLGKINRELGITVVITEHRLEEAFPYATRVVVMEEGTVLCDGTPKQVGLTLRENNHTMFPAMPTAMRVWASVKTESECPITVREGSDFLENERRKHGLLPLADEPNREYEEEPAFSCNDVWFRYEKSSPDVLKGMSLTVRKGEFYALLGGNGTGKTTSLKVLGGLRIACRGTVRANGRIGLLPQNPQTLFLRKTVRDDLGEALADRKLSREEIRTKVDEVLELCRITDIQGRHPYDISGGEQQRAALAKVLLTEPDCLLLDEPTKGFDAGFKMIFADIIETLTSRGIAILMVSHDVSFCADYAHRCGMFFDGKIIAEGTPREFFSGNDFYTTPANRMARKEIPQAVTVRDIVSCLGGQSGTEARPKSPDSTGRKNPGGEPEHQSECQAEDITEHRKECQTEHQTENKPEHQTENKPEHRDECQSEPQRASKTRSRRSVLLTVGSLMLIPVTVLAGIFLLDNRHYNLMAVLVLFECMLPFFCSFEGRKPQARELVTIAVLCAIGVAGRCVFFMIPQVKPVLALTVIAGIAYGGEIGFLVGATTMLASNMIFSQGPWTPWQMVAMGLCGCLAGVLAKTGLLRKKRIPIAIFGAFAALVIYGGIMNPASALIASPGSLNRTMLLAYYAAGLPMDLIHAFGTVVFLMMAAEPMLEKTDRIKYKYGILQEARKE